MTTRSKLTKDVNCYACGIAISYAVTHDGHEPRVGQCALCECGAWFIFTKGPGIRCLTQVELDYVKTRIAQNN